MGGERAEHLGGSAVVEPVKAAAQGLAVQRDAALSRRGTRRLQQGGVASERSLHLNRIEPLKDVADGGVRGCPTPVQATGRVQPGAVNTDEGDDAAI